MNPYPKEFHVTEPMVGTKVWLGIERFYSGRKAFPGPCWIESIFGTDIIKIKAADGREATVLLGDLIRVSRQDIKKMTGMSRPPK